MRDLITVRGGLTQLRWSTRFVYTLFLIFCFANYAVMSVMAISRSGFSSQGIAAYYAGDEAAMTYAKTPAELLEVTHFHLFAMPLLLFVQGHLFLLTRWPLRRKVVLVLAAAAGVALDIAAPWLIVYLSPSLAPVKNAARVLMAAGFLAFAAVPLWEMWCARPAPAAAAEEAEGGR